MGRAKRKYRLVTFYIEDKFRPIFETFEDLIEKDNDIVKPDDGSGAKGKLSLAIKMLIGKYVAEKGGGNNEGSESDNTEVQSIIS